MTVDTDGLGSRLRAFGGAVNRERAWLRKTLRVTRNLGVHLLHSQIPRMSAALAFRTLFSLVPVVVLGLVVLGTFAGDDDIEKLLHEVLDYAGLTEIAISPDSAEEAGVGPPIDRSSPEAPPAADESGVMELPTGPSDDPAEQIQARAEAQEKAETQAEVQRRTQRLDEWIATIVTSVRDTSLAAIGVVGLVFLVYAAIAMLVEVERSFNTVYRAPRGRSWIRRVPAYWMALTLGSTFLVLTFYVGERLRGTLQSIIEWADLGLVSSVLITAIGPAFSISLSTLILVTFYATLPNTRVRLRPAMAGAAIAAVLWEVAKFGFTEYVAYSTSYARIYGSIALVPLFMLWVYVTWVIVLFGLSIAAAMQFDVFDEAWSDGGDEGRSSRPMSPAAMAAVAGALAHAFREGESIALSGLTSIAGLTREQTGALIDRLMGAHVVHELLPEQHTEHAEPGSRRRPADDEDDESARRFALSRPPESIAIVDLVDLAEPANQRPATSIGERYAEMRRRAFAGRTLADLLAEREAAADSRPEPVEGGRIALDASAAGGRADEADGDGRGAGGSR